MKTTMTISVEKGIKAEFKAFAKEMGTNPTTLLSMFMRDSTKKGRVSFGNYLYKETAEEEEELDTYFGKILVESDTRDYVSEGEVLSALK